jgi:glycosyltransferase involved in cell wall biosynthesis
MSNYKISIAIPVYNGGKSIIKVINSCLEQIGDIEYQILVVDNASTDETSEILRQISEEKNIKIITNQSTVPLFENHNIALMNADADYVLFCHADDLLEPHAIKTVWKKISEREFPKKYILWGHSMFKDFSLYIIRANLEIGKIFAGEYAVLPFMYGGLTPSGTCYSRSSFLELGGFIKTSTKLEPADMTSMILAALNRFRFEMMEEIIFCREQASTMKKNTSYDDVLYSIDQAIIKLIQILPPEKILNILQTSTYLKIIPTTFYSSLSNYHPAKKLLRKIIFKKTLKSPNLLFNKPYMVLIKRLFF